MKTTSNFVPGALYRTLREFPESDTATVHVMAECGSFPIVENRVVMFLRYVEVTRFKGGTAIGGLCLFDDKVGLLCTYSWDQLDFLPLQLFLLEENQ